MSYKALIGKNVDKAFKLLRDLAVDATLTSTRDSGFNFATNAPTSVVTSSKVISAVPISKRRSLGRDLPTSIEHSFLFKASDIPDPTIYDTITVAGGQVWRVTSPYDNDGFVVTATVTRVV